MSTHKKKHPHSQDATHRPQKASGHQAEATRETRRAPVATAAAPTTRMRMFMLAVLVVAAFFGAYRFARASTSNPATAYTGVVGSATSAASAVLGATGLDNSAGGGGCCGGGGGAPIEGVATVEGGVQKISVDLSSGSYNPNIIKLKAGVPTEITFGQSAGCTSVVASSDLGFQEDLTAGPKTVKLQSLAAGTYNFACGMNMVTGQIVVL